MVKGYTWEYNSFANKISGTGIQKVEGRRNTKMYNSTKFTLRKCS